MGLKKLLTDLSDGKQNEFTQGIDFKQRSMPWPDSYEEGKPLLTRRNFDEKAFEDLDQGSPEPNSEAVSFGRDDGDLRTNRRLDDFRRIGKWIYGTGEGRGWIVKQAGLQLMNPRLDAPQKTLLESAQEGLEGMFDFSGEKIRDPNQLTYNGGVNTVIQTLIAGKGSIDREGGVPLIHSGYIDAAGKNTWGMEGSLAQSFEPGMGYKKGEKYNLDDDKNRLTFLLNNKLRLPGEPLGFLRDTGLGGTAVGDALTAASEFVTENLPFLFGNLGEELFSYVGGPKSRFGLGRTTHRRYTNSGVDNYGKTLPVLYQSPVRLGFNYSNEEIEVSPTKLGNFLSQHWQFQDRKRPYFIYSKKIGDTGRTYHYGSRIGAGDPGKIMPLDGDGLAWNSNKEWPNKGLISYKAFVPDKIDKVNALDIHKATDIFSDIVYRDFIKFRIEAIDSNSPPEALESDVLIFRAFIDDIGDSFNAEHNEFKYNGRADYFYTYKGFKRDISVSFKIAAQSRHEMMPLYRKLNFLVSNTAPDYSESGRMRTPYIRLTVGNWMERIPGIITSISLKWGTDYPWEIALTEPEEEKTGEAGTAKQADMLILPHILDVTLNFTPIHSFLPQKGVHTPFILPDPSLKKPNQQWLKGESTDLNTVKTFLDMPSYARMKEDN